MKVQMYAVDGLIAAGTWVRIQLPPMSLHAAYNWISYHIDPNNKRKHKDTYQMIRLVRL
jgi:hypothetical protein